MEVDLTKDLHKKGTKDGMFNSLYPRNKITKCAEGTFNILDVPAINVSLRECVEKASLFVSQGYRICNYKASCQNIFCSCRKSFKGKCHSCWYTPFCFYKYILFSFLTNWCHEKYILAVLFKRKTPVDNWIVIYPFFLSLLLSMYIPQPKLVILHISQKKTVIIHSFWLMC